MIAEDDKVVVRNHWTATDSQNGNKLEFRGIVIWRISNRQIVESGLTSSRRILLDRVPRSSRAPQLRPASLKY